MDDIQNQIDNISERLDENDNSLQEFSDSLDSSISDMQDSINTLEENSGQLTFPLSQDTIDLITEQAPTIMQVYEQQGYVGNIQLSGGTATLINPNINTNSIIIYSVKTSSGVPQITSAGLPVNHLYYYYVLSAGQAVFHSSITTDTSTLSYLII